MPNLTKIGDKWLFTVTPLGADSGVKAMYWVGTINADGTFNPASSTPGTVELSGFAKDGYGLLSPSIAQVDGKTIAMGIVPDKLVSQYNYDLGWAHTYSLPREWSLTDDNKLIQRPFAGLQGMRDPAAKVNMDINVDGYRKIADMNGRKVEVIGEFTVGSADFGLAFYSDNGSGAVLSYSPSTGKLTLDMRKLPRWSNDDRSFDGLYTTALPAMIAAGSIMKMHVFVDHSVMDIFINDMWASSVRLFPTEAASAGLEVFSDGGSTATKIEAWALSGNEAGINDVVSDNCPSAEYVTVYNTMGMPVRSLVHSSEALADLPAGIYIVEGKKYLVR